MDYATLLPTVPYDEEGFTQSFSIDEGSEMKKFYDDFGFVVVKNAITDHQADASLSEIWDTIEHESVEMCERTKSRKPKPGFFNSLINSFTPTKPEDITVSRDRVDTWEENWPYGKGGVGIIGNGVCFGKAAWDNRQAEGIYKAHSIILGTDDLLVSCDRYGFMRPTKGITLASGELVDKPDWKTKEKWVHWDFNP